MKKLVLLLLFAVPVFGQDTKLADTKSPETVQAPAQTPVQAQVLKPDKPDAAWKEEFQQAIQLSNQIETAKKTAGIDKLESLLAELEADLAKKMGEGKKYDPGTDTFVPDKAVEKKQ